MRPLFLSPALLLIGACSSDPDPRPPPQSRFVYPSGIVHRDVPGTTSGALYVASANFDKCFDSGSVLAVDLDQVGPQESRGLPPLGGAAGTQGPVQIPELNVAENGFVQIASFAGEMALWSPEGRAPRLFVPTRSEGSFLHAIDIQDSEGRTALSCPQEGRDCQASALSLTAVPGAEEGQPRAPAPLGVTVADDEVWVTHLEAADSPEGSATNNQTYVVHVPADSLTLSSESFFPLGNAAAGLSLGGTHSVAVGKRYVYATGRNYTIGQGTFQSARFVLRLLDRQVPGRQVDPNLSAAYNTLEARGVALSADETRLYVVARSPDTLLVLDLADTETSSPTLAVVNAVPLPGGASQLVVIPREFPGRGSIVAVTCGSAGVVALYDEEVGQVVAQVAGVGVQPYGITADLRGNAARLFVSNFGDGRVAVIDLPSLDVPQAAQLVAHLGTQQELDPDQGTTVCQEDQQ